MLFRQLFEKQSSTYTYLIAEKTGGEALIIDPVLENVDHYLRLLRELDLKLVKAIDTHVHADHVTALGALRDTTRCITVMGEQSGVDVVSMRVTDGDQVTAGNISIEAMYTPGHTDCSYSFKMKDRVFTGDTLLIRGTGRTDFQNGNAYDQYHSLFDKLLKLPDDTLVYPAHDYKGDMVSTIAEEKAFNPRLQVSSADEYAEIMAALNLPNPKQMDVAVPRNTSIGYRSDDPWLREHSLSPDECRALLDDGSTIFVDLREPHEQQKHGRIPGAIDVPFNQIVNMSGDLPLEPHLADRGKNLLLFCAYGERSALALQTLHENGFDAARHMSGGIEGWRTAGGPVTD